MACDTSSNFTNITTNQFTNISLKEDTRNVPHQINVVITIIFNCLTCPLTVLLNVLVIMGVKRRPRLRSKTNILLACLAATDVFTGLSVQPSCITWNIFELLGMPYCGPYLFHNAFLRVLSICSCLHLMIVTCERLIAIKFTVRPYLVTTRNIKVVVIAVWFYSVSGVALKPLINTETILNFLLGFALLSCILFIVAAYIILYRETLRHRKMIKMIAHQLPQKEVERFTKESKALKTTVFLVGAVVLCSLPIALTILSFAFELNLGLQNSSAALWIRTFAMLNSLLNPLIYCWRQKEMRQFIFRFSPVVALAHYNDTVTIKRKETCKNQCKCCL